MQIKDVADLDENYFVNMHVCANGGASRFDRLLPVTFRDGLT